MPSDVFSALLGWDTQTPGANRQTAPAVGEAKGFNIQDVPPDIRALLGWEGKYAVENGSAAGYNHNWKNTAEASSRDSLEDNPLLLTGKYSKYRDSADAAYAPPSLPPGLQDDASAFAYLDTQKAYESARAEMEQSGELLAEGAGDGLNKAGIAKTKVDEILKTPKYSRPDPATYLEKKYIANHKTQFKDGVTKISYQAPTGYAGPPGGTFVMPTSVADDLTARAGGDISELERLLGLDPGELGTNPVRIDIANPSGLRIPSGNEKGANPKWIPGGYTSGGIPEIIIDSPKPGQYTVRPIK